VGRRRAEYAAWGGGERRLVLDAVADLPSNVAAALRYVRAVG
jgi:hypothetical protein